MIERIVAFTSQAAFSTNVLLVDDGSTDSTAKLMHELCLANTSFSGIFLSRNFGHQIAITAGLAKADATEAVVVMDGDLQDPPELIEQLYATYKEGYDVVYAVRRNRQESLMLRICYKGYYRLMRAMSNIYIPIDTGDFSLLSRRVVNALNQMPEQNRFIRGMRSWVGFTQKGIVYDRQSRNKGHSKYSFQRLITLALNGVFNFSVIPIKAITLTGAATTTVGFLYLLYTSYKHLVHDVLPEGFTAIVLLIILFGGVQLFAIGIIGEYLIRILFETKQRPLFLISKEIKSGKVIVE